MMTTVRMSSWSHFRASSWTFALIVSIFFARVQPSLYNCPQLSKAIVDEVIQKLNLSTPSLVNVKKVSELDLQ